MPYIGASDLFYVYAHITPSNKIYIGITSRPNINDRWGKNGNNYNENIYFKRAIKKYGWDNIQHIILFENLSKEVACECEKYLIAKYNTTDRKYGYNIQIGGLSGTAGIVMSDEVRKKISDKNRGRKLTDEQRKHISDGLKSIPHSKEHNENVSKALKGKYVKELSPVYGKKFTDEHRRKISESLKGHKPTMPEEKFVAVTHSESANAKRHKTFVERQTNVGKNNGFYGKIHTEAVRQHISEQLRGRIWVTNVDLRQNHFIYPCELDKYLKLGYKRGFTKWKLMD